MWIPFNGELILLSKKMASYFYTGGVRSQRGLRGDVMEERGKRGRGRKNRGPERKEED